MGFNLLVVAGRVMGEAAGACSIALLEELEHAKVLQSMLSFWVEASLVMTEPHPQGTSVILCIEKALSQAGVSREDVNYINAHATSTPVKEYQPLLHCFGQM
ncbi:3-oxoacyl-[acyl-carrier-protein] synthase II, chloroplastic-like [Bidens hawaiensis]|uniref:3-oxoacyl-[acyl-carrier-protein] synthase II, chloroplastic-like n=1 Tax=Bidens hawaiensis TaxID=980011 RepID=UPI004049BE9D